MLDGEGGYTVWGRLMLAGDSLGLGAVPIGLAHGATIKNPVKEGGVITWSDLELDPTLTESTAYTVRRKMESTMAAAPGLEPVS